MDDCSCCIGAVVRGIRSRTKFEAIHELIEKSSQLAGLDDPSRFEQAVVEREREASTGLGRGIALAHGKFPGIHGVMVMLGVSDEGIDFDANDGMPVNLLFIFGNPPRREPEYLAVISALAAKLRDEAFRSTLLRQKHAASIRKMLQAAIFHHA